MGVLFGYLEGSNKWIILMFDLSISFRFGGSVKRNDLYALDLKTKEWREIQPKGTLPLPLMNFGSVVSGNCLYIFAGHGQISNNHLFEFNFGM
jgi:hypothetical protein